MGADNQQLNGYCRAHKHGKLWSSVPALPGTRTVRGRPRRPCLRGLLRGTIGRTMDRDRAEARGPVGNQRIALLKMCK